MLTAPAAARSAGYAARDTTQPPNWHGLVVWDVFFNALATGVFLVAAVGELTRPGAFAPVATWAYPLALAFLLIDLSLLVLDLGDPLRFHHMLRVFKPSSPMSLGTWCLTAFSLPMAAIVVLDLFGVTGGVRTVLLVIAMPFAFGSAAYKGVLFSTSSQPGWRDARWLGAYHTGGAFVFGCAMLFALAALTGHDQAAISLRPALAVLLVLHAVPLVLLARELWPTLRTRYTFAERVRDGAMVGVGVIVPLAALAFGSGPGVAILACVFVLLSGWVARHRLVLLPHARPHD